MEFITCKFGHRYDPSITPECPECAMMAGMGGHTVPLIGGNDLGFGGAEEIGKTVPLRRDTVPVNPVAGINWAETSEFMATGPVGGMAEGYSPTMPLNFDQGGINDKASQPVTGWLVCIDGPEKGRDYRIHDEYNYIGRESDADICIAGDPTVSRSKHAIIAYDSQERMFFFAPASGASIVRHNGKAVLNNVELKNGDRIQIGKGTYIFVPLCGENFQWEE